MTGIFSFQFEELNISPSQIERFMGYKNAEIPSPFKVLIEEVLCKAKEISDIKGGIIIKNNIQVNHSEGNLMIDKEVFSIKKIISSQLRKSERIAIFVCTAGDKIGNWSKQLMADGDLMKGYVADAVGSEVVETAMDKIQNLLEKNMTGEKSCGITNRYSPGYCGWDVSEQHKLFRLLPENYCGVKLTESALMDPIKSVSGIIGIGKEVKKNDYSCNRCDMKNCIYRDKHINNLP